MDNKTAQQKLVDWGLLDPPADGKWGSLSRSALLEFESIHGVVADGVLTPTIQSLLAKVGAPPEIKAGGLLKKVIDYYQKKDYWIARGSNVYNIFYRTYLTSYEVLN